MKYGKKLVIFLHACKKNEFQFLIPGIANRTFGNRTQSNSIRGLSSIEFGNRTKSNGRICVSSISEPIELNRTQSNGRIASPQ